MTKKQRHSLVLRTTLTLGLTARLVEIMVHDENVLWVIAYSLLIAWFVNSIVEDIFPEA